MNTENTASKNLNIATEIKRMEEVLSYLEDRLKLLGSRMENISVAPPVQSANQTPLIHKPMSAFATTLEGFNTRIVALGNGVQECLNNLDL